MAKVDVEVEATTSGRLLYVLLIGCFLPALAGRPGPLLYASIFLLPIMQAMPVPIEVLTAPINLVLLGLAFAPSSAWSSLGAPKRMPLRGPILFLSCAMVLGLLIRAYGDARGEFFETPLEDAAKATWGSVTVFVLYALVFRQLTRAEPSVSRRMIVFCQLSFVAQGAVAVLDHLRGADRATGYLSESNSAGSYFAASTAFFMAYALFGKPSRRAIYLASFVISLIGVGFSISRGAMLATVVSCALVLAIFFTAARQRTGTKVLVIVVVVLLAANATLIVPQFVIDRVLLTFGGTVPHAHEETQIDDSSAQRILFWKTGWQLFKEWPLGYGTETYPQLNEERTGYRKASHNIYVATLVEFGAQGMVALVLLVIAVFSYLGSAYGRATDDEQRSLALGLLGWWTAHATAHFFITDFHSVQIAGQFWMLLACLASMGSQPPVAESSATRAGIPARQRR
jgi:hypothetical protein